jgi:hypothetical protein
VSRGDEAVQALGVEKRHASSNGNHTDIGKAIDVLESRWRLLLIAQVNPALEDARFAYALERNLFGTADLA